MLSILDLMISFLDWVVTSIGIRRAAWISLGAAVVVGVAALAAFDAPGWAAIAFAGAAIDGWTLTHSAFSDEEESDA